ncbi:hypothetical protein HYW82_00435 [Candidatus Peregrinibacteria bacterium]|nr:hypothetical protein [Candidatus Peregrinibacteria bacterium]
MLLDRRELFEGLAVRNGSEIKQQPESVDETMPVLVIKRRTALLAGAAFLLETACAPVVSQNVAPSHTGRESGHKFTEEQKKLLLEIEEKTKAFGTAYNAFLKEFEGVNLDILSIENTDSLYHRAIDQWGIIRKMEKGLKELFEKGISSVELNNHFLSELQRLLMMAPASSDERSKKLMLIKQRFNMRFAFFIGDMNDDNLEYTQSFPNVSVIMLSADWCKECEDSMNAFAMLKVEYMRDNVTNFTRLRVQDGDRNDLNPECLRWIEANKDDGTLVKRIPQYIVVHNGNFVGSIAGAIHDKELLLSAVIEVLDHYRGSLRQRYETPGKEI